MPEHIVQSSHRKLKLFKRGMVASVFLAPLIAAGYIGSHGSGWDIIGAVLTGLFYIPSYALVAFITCTIGYTRQRNLLIKYNSLPQRETWLRLTYLLIGSFSVSCTLSFILFFFMMLFIYHAN